MARYFLAENAESADFKSPAEIKEIKEMSPSENVVESIMRSKKILKIINKMFGGFKNYSYLCIVNQK